MDENGRKMYQNQSIMHKINRKWTPMDINGWKWMKNWWAVDEKWLKMDENKFKTWKWINMNIGMNTKNKWKWMKMDKNRCK